MDYDVRTPLARPSSEVLLAENTRVTALLTAQPASASAHESAALLAAVFAWREFDDVFSDPRPAMARVTAHLAAADALRRNAAVTLDGALARIALDTLVGHQRQALSGLGALAMRLTSPAERAWDRAIRLRNTGNWREAGETDDGFLIERLELARALRQRINHQAMEAAVPRLARRDEALEWSRLVLSGTFSVGMGRAVADAAAEPEWAEARRVWRAVHADAALPADLIPALNEPASPSGERTGTRGNLTVLDWPLWADFSQRQILRSAFAQHHLLSMLGLPDKELASMRTIKAEYGAFVLYPVLLHRAATSDDDTEQAKRLARPLIAGTPERVTESAWHGLSTAPSPAGQPDRFPAAASWFAPAVPAGTAFELSNRALRNGFRSAATTDQLRTWAEVRPFDRWTAWSYLRRLGDQAPTLEAARRAFGPLTQYDLRALRQLALQTYATPADRMATMQHMCEVSDFGCEDLALYQVREGQDSKAAASFERWLHATPDAVHAANSSAWLTRYYVHTGQFARAEALAREAGDAFSNRGMQVLGYFLDARGRDAEAEQVYRRIQERYDLGEPLGTFLVRRGIRQGDPAQQQKGWDLLKALFPAGAERLAWNTLTGPPTDGIVFETFGLRASAQGLKRNDVIVGVDEWRVRTAMQYPILADLRHDETMTFTVWRDGRYHQIHARMRERWLGMELGTYGPK